jgi:hypothetical protein
MVTRYYLKKHVNIMLWKIWNNLLSQFLFPESRRLISVGNVEALVASSCALVLSNESNSRFVRFSPEKTLCLRILSRGLLAYGLKKETAVGKRTAFIWIYGLDKEAGYFSETVSYPEGAQYESWSLRKLQM